jgi:hypothetical protein
MQRVFAGSEAGLRSPANHYEIRFLSYRLPDHCLRCTDKRLLGAEAGLRRLGGRDERFWGRDGECARETLNETWNTLFSLLDLLSREPGLIRPTRIDVKW